MLTVDQIAEKYFPIAHSDCLRTRNIKSQLRQQLKNDINDLLNDQERKKRAEKPATKATR